MRLQLAYLICFLSFSPVSYCLNKDNNALAHSTTSELIDFYQHQNVDSNGVNIHYLESGKGQVMVFLHGYPFYGLSWDKLLRPFSASYHVVAPDNRGYNLSDKPSKVDEYKLSKLVGDVVALANKVSPKQKIILVGHDWGGALAWTFAQLHPERVDKLIVLNAPPLNVLLNNLQNDPEQQKASAYMDILKSGKVEAMFRQTGPDMLWNYGFNKLYEAGNLDDVFKQGFYSAWQQVEALTSALNWYRANIPPFDKIDDDSYFPAKSTRVSVPSLLIWTEHERTFSRSSIEKTAELADNLKIEWIMDSGHSPFLDKAEQVVTLITNFLKVDDSEIH
ncbi:alpha/beta fold hydrolase [Paraglaciecola sp.]|uniref:alpha/beta fold hydrolase n=1 Tax=Paraglaciecola sp. TaxID=1920173 RepID=UPI00273D28C6|nr:alpha/beta fold hydrolase [Paraglaciecola sp.]MDP5030390.1 alpha/beta fold hydrolase [Paraglaciecola sp.]